MLDLKKNFQESINAHLEKIKYYFKDRIEQFISVDEILENKID